MKKYDNFKFKFLMCMGLVMLYFTIVYIVPNEMNNPFNQSTVISFSIAYIPWACLYFNNSVKSNSEAN